MKYTITFKDRDHITANIKEGGKLLNDCVHARNEREMQTIYNYLMHNAYRYCNVHVYDEDGNLVK